MNAFLQSVIRDIREFKTLEPQAKRMLLIQLCVLLIISIAIGMLFSPRFRSRPSSTNTAQPAVKTTNLAISPKDHIMKIGETAEFTVQLTGESPTAADIVIAYDPLTVQVTSVKNGNVFDREIINKIGKGTITFSAAHSPGQTGMKTDDTVVTFNVKALKKTEATELTFNTDETISAKAGKNIIGTTQNAVIHIFD